MEFYEQNIIIFSILPVLGFVINFFFKLLNKDYSKIVYKLFISLQFFSGIYIFYQFPSNPLIIRLSIFKDYAPVFEISSIRLIFLMLYMLMIFFLFFTKKYQNSFEDKISIMIFQAFLAGCSGLIFSKDMFSYFVYYELMILCSYILITSNKKYFAALKYMIFNSISSMFFLAGIGYNYYSTGSLLIDPVIINNKIAIMFFLIAFLIKGGFFPASSWVPTCHSGAGNVFSGCLSSYAISTGVLGLYRFVALPSFEHNYTSFMDIIKIISVITIFSSSFLLFLEKNLKKALTHSTVYVMGVCGILLGSGEKSLVFIYLIIHCFYKMFLFIILFDIDFSENNTFLHVKSSSNVFWLFSLAVLIAAGIFPSFTYFAKMSFDNYFYGIKILWYISMFFILAGFFKFKFIKNSKFKMKDKKVFFMGSAYSIPVFLFAAKKVAFIGLILKKIIALIVAGGIKGFVSKLVVSLIAVQNIEWLKIHEYFYIDIIILLIAYFLSYNMYMKYVRYNKGLNSLTSNDLNVELFLILVLSSFCFNYIYFGL